MKQRHAYSLVEMVVAIGLTAVILSVTAMTMHSLHRAEHRMRGDFQQQRTLKRLVTQLRQDAHAASSASVAKGQDANTPAQQVTLEMPDGKAIRYAVHTNRFEREVLEKSNVEHRETFRLLGPNSKWTIKELDGRTLLTLHLINAAQQQSAAQDAANLEIHAAVGLSAAANRERD
jgi:hypothetical protein